MTDYQNIPWDNIVEFGQQTMLKSRLLRFHGYWLDFVIIRAVIAGLTQDLVPPTTKI
jgi:hypothetical protein